MQRKRGSVFSKAYMNDENAENFVFPKFPKTTEEKAYIRKVLGKIFLTRSLMAD